MKDLGSINVDALVDAHEILPPFGRLDDKEEEGRLDDKEEEGRLDDNS